LKLKTSLFAILLVATIIGISTAALVQADNESSVRVATFGTNGGPTDGTTFNAFAGGAPINHEYKDVAESKSDTIENTNPASLPGGFFDAVEKTAQRTGVFPVPDKAIPTMYTLGPTPLSPMNIVRGYEEATFTFDNLPPGAVYAVTVIIRDLDDFGLFEDAALSMPLPETVLVTGNGLSLGTVDAVVGSGTTQVITKTLLTSATVDGSGQLTIGFNENFQWDPSPISIWDGLGFFCTPTKATDTGGPALTPFCIPSQTGVRVEQISLFRSTITTFINDVNCSFVLPGDTVNGNVFQDDGSTCTLDDNTVNGDVIISGGSSLIVKGGTEISGDVKFSGGSGDLNIGTAEINGNVETDGASKVTIEAFPVIHGSVILKGSDEFIDIGRAVIDGDVRIEETDSSRGIRVNDNTIGGDIEILKNTVTWIQVKGNDFSSGNIRVIENTATNDNGGVAIGVIENGGSNPTNIEVNKNKAEQGGATIEVNDNEIDGNLECADNDPDPTEDGNDVAGNTECPK